MACLRDLPLPEPDSGRSIGSRGSASSAGGWDENVGESRARFSFEQAAAAADSSRRSCSVATHAVAHGCKVLGIKPADGPGQYGEGADDDAVQDGGWIAWEATFEPHRVCRVASSLDGSVVVASTAGGTVSLLRGADGSVLATRRVYSTDDEENSSLPAEITFVAGARRHDSVVNDVLIIVVPPREAGLHCDKAGGAMDEFGNPLSSGDHQPYINVILVSGIDGSSLNSSDPAAVASAARGMSIDALELSLPSESNDGHVASLNGCFVSDHVIRFLAADDAGNFSAHDYDVKTKTAEFIDAKILNDSLCEGEDGAFEELVGIRVDDRRGMFALCTSMNSSTKLCYYDVVDLKPQCEYIIPASSRKDRPKLYALEPVRGYGESTVAAVIAFKRSPSSAEGSIQVIQAVIGAEDSCFHLVYSVPVEPSIDQSIRWIDIAPLEQSGMQPYSFHYKVSYDSGVGECKQFDCVGGGTVGGFRVLLAQGRFDDADALLAAAGTSGVISSPFASIHGSEVALWRFRHILDEGNVCTAESMTQAKECLRRLAAGAVSGGEIGVQCLLDASETLMSWPNEPSSGQSDDSDESYGPRTQEYRSALTAMSSTIGGAMKATPPLHLPSLKAQKRKLDARVSAMRCLESVLQIKTEGVFLTLPLSAATSPADLFRVFVSQGAFVVAERVRLSEYGKSITPECMATAIVGVSSSIDPRSYISWLRDIIIPGITINHPLLLAIRSWACQTADAFDADNSNLGIDASITLLKTVADATAKLSASIHSSFASSPPFVEDDVSGFSGKEPEEVDASSDSSFSSIGASVSNVSDPSQPSFIKPPNPTVMKLGLLRGAPRQKSSKSFLARRVRRVGGSSGAAGRMDVSLQDTSASDAETYRVYAEFMDKEDEDEYVETKLLQASCLKEARSLGLSKRIVSLANYAEVGGSTFIAKELIRLSSATASGDSEREGKVMENVLPFCKQAGIDFDGVLSMYTKEICDSNRNNPRILLEAASLSRICSASTKCEVALKVLRAALLCNDQPPALSDLSKDAILWALDEGVRSELEEAARLLVVDRIVRRYCGNGAQELFRVSDPRHGLKLLQFVCRHIDEPSVLFDALALCDAFTHLFRSEACLLILKRMAMATHPTIRASNRAEQCASLLRTVYAMDAALADGVGEQLCAFCVDTVEDCGTMLDGGESAHIKRKQSDAMAASSAAVSILAVMQESKAVHRCIHAKSSASMSRVGSSCLVSVLQEFQCIQELQADFSIFVTLSDLRKRTKHDEIARLLLRPAVDFFVANNGALHEQRKTKSLRSTVTCARRGLTLLFVNNHADAASYWCKAVGDHAIQLAMSSDDDSACMSFAHAAGLLDDMSSESAFDAVYSIATAHCIRASKVTCGVPVSEENDFSASSQSESALFAMKSIIRASSLLQEHALRYCPQRLLCPLVALTGLTDTVSQVLVRADGGSGEAIDLFRSELNGRARNRREAFFERDSSVANKPNSNIKLPPSQPLHPSWYIGDGLLLPPLEALVHCMHYCKHFMRQTSQKKLPIASDASDGIYSFLGSRGAYTIALRMHACSTAAAMLSSQSTMDFSFDLDKVMPSNEHCVRSLAERSLGGSGNGITSGNIDSQLAFAYLLSLPMKLAFKVYRASLPSAISRRDFPRVSILANIGVRAGDGGSVACWRNQEIFVGQCRRLADNARWWGVLRRFGVTFDPKRFEGSDKSQVDAYIATLVLPFIVGSSKALHIFTSLHKVIELATKFVCAFGLDEKLAAQKYIEFLLGGVEQNDASKSDIRHNLVVCEDAARDTLLLLPSPMARAAILRRCLISLESSEDCFKDYNRYACVISLYLSELSLVLADGASKKDASAFQEEYERIDRRQDAIAILSSFFKEKPLQERPAFPSLFLPLPTPFKSDRGKAKPRFCGILGHKSALAMPDDFDPLLPLIPCLSADCGPSTASALSPLCLSLGLPSGYIHARSLYTQLVKAKSIGSALPAFETSVRPVINRIKAPGDGAELAEWCAMQYNNGTTDRLQCLELALSLAFRASREAEEQVRRNRGEEAFVENERRALETVKRISDMKAALADRIRVENILEQGKTSSSSHTDLMLTDLVEKVQSTNAKSSNLSPESFVEGLLVEGSLMTALASLDESIRFTTDDFRQVACCVHEACKGLAEQYSHVAIGKTARTLARRWLVHGDDVSSKERCDDDQKITEAPKSKLLKKDEEPCTPQESLVHMEDDDVTSEFVMDLNVLGSGGDVWSDDVGSGLDASNKMDSVIADEEPSALSCVKSARERTEHANARVALRIAFVMSFADGYYSEDNEDGNNENVETHKVPQTASKLNSSFSVRSRASESSKVGSTQGDRVIEHARELLGIAFAKSGGATWRSDSGFESMTRDSSASYILSERTRASQNISAFDGEISRKGTSQEGKIHSFAMRHRALRAASILCPQEALEIVVRDEGYFDTNREQTATLGKCAFGSFLAMEIEAMGLPLPHSDLVQLSTMHFPSYARALWRHHGQNECRGYKGRLLVLLLELCLKDGKDGTVSDVTLVQSVLKQLVSRALPRSLLMSWELIISNNAVKAVMAADYPDDTLLSAIGIITKLILAELRTKPEDLNVNQSLSTIQRLGHIIAQLNGNGVDKEQLKAMCDVAADCGDEQLSRGVLHVVAKTASCLEIGDGHSVFSEIVRHGGRSILEENFGSVNDGVFCVDATQPQEVQFSTVMTQMQMIEAMFRRGLAASIQE